MSSFAALRRERDRGVFSAPDASGANFTTVALYSFLLIPRHGFNATAEGEEALFPTTLVEAATFWGRVSGDD